MLERVTSRFRAAVRRLATAAANGLVSAGRAAAGGWYPIVREPFTGAWQANADQISATYFQNPTVFSCVTLIAGDIGKMRLRMMQLDDNGIWIEKPTSAFSPLLRKPNRYQVTPKFIQQWILSKLLAGNAYILKQRDARGVVNALYVLDPLKVRPLVAPDGSVFYQVGYQNYLEADALARAIELGQDHAPAIPASEIIHDVMYPAPSVGLTTHPLIGVSPIVAAGLPALEAMNISGNSASLFANGAKPGGVILVPGDIQQADADKITAYWNTNYTGDGAGKVALLSNGLKYETITMTATDAQLIEQLHWTAEAIAACYHVPIDLIQQPHAGGAKHWTPEQLLQMYFSQCLQALVVDFETVLDDGLELAPTLGTEFDVDDLIWMDTATKTKAAADTIGAGAASPNEARARWLGWGPVAGGDTPYLQQQYWSLEALAERDTIPAATPAAIVPADDFAKAFADALTLAFERRRHAN